MSDEGIRVTGTPGADLHLTNVTSSSTAPWVASRATDEERLADIERRNADGYGEPGDIEWLIVCVRALTAERDALIVERDAWKIRVTG